ncbi:MAG: hypothetical protein AAFQ89_19055 [Cyanobacteria bacterium J06626_18]
MQESEDDFLSLFPHRYDYIYAPHPKPSDRPQWQTESRYPLSDRLFQQGAYLFGVRFGQQTNYCLLDVDTGSAYHPSCDPLAIQRIVAALEPIGLVSCVVCTSSYSQGLHLYFPFEDAQNSWYLSTVVTSLLENQGFKCQSGQLEVFPNPKLYVLDGTPNLFNAHRLPLQAGSYLLNSQFEPIFGSHEAFVRQWCQCQAQNVVEVSVVEQVLKQIRRQHYRVSERADKFLNDLNAEIEPGWTGKGQTNYLLGRITMRCYIFHHVLQGGTPLSGKALVDEIVSVAISLPGYRDWCDHQHEIRQRAEEWARCIENSRYFPYGTQKGKYKATGTDLDPSALGKGSSITWNEQRSRTAQTKIEAAVAELHELNQLPETATTRFKKLLTYGIGGSTLYKYKDLWHPDLWKTPQTPLPSPEGGASATASPAVAPHPPSLLPIDDSNPSDDSALSDGEGADSEAEVRNQQRQVWRQTLADLKKRREQQQIERRSRQQVHSEAIAQANQQVMAQKMQDYLRSEDPILMKEALSWFIQQETYPPWSLPALESVGLSAQDERRQTLVAVFQALLRLQWRPADIRRSLQETFGQGAIAELSFKELHQWNVLLGQLLQEVGRAIEIADTMQLFQVP